MNFARRFASRSRKKFQTSNPEDLAASYFIIMGVVPFMTSATILSYRLGKKNSCINHNKHRWDSCYRCEKYHELPWYWPLDGPGPFSKILDFGDVTFHSVYLSTWSLGAPITFPYWIVTHGTRKIGSWVGLSKN